MRWRDFLVWFAGVLVVGTSYGQTPSPLRWINQTFDYGTTETPAREAAVFEVKNVSDRTVTLSPVKVGRGVEVSPERLRLAPGQIGAFRAYFKPSKRGRFSRQFTVATEGGHRYTLFIKGRALNPRGQVDECPDMTTQVRYSAPDYSLRVRVLDAETGLPIRRSRLTVEGARGRAYGGTDAEGFFKKTLPIGQYFIRVEKSGYLPADTFAYVNHAARLVRIYLRPLAQHAEAAAPPAEASPKAPPPTPPKPAPTDVIITVKDTLTGKPLGRTALAVRTAEGRYQGKWYTTPQGTARLRLVPGTYMLDARRTGYAGREIRLAVQPGVVDYTVWLAPSAVARTTEKKQPAAGTAAGAAVSHRLRVVRPDGTVLPDVRISIYRDGRYQGRYVIDRQGRPLSWSASAGTYRLTLYDPESRMRWDTVLAVPAQSTTFTLAAPLAVAPASPPPAARPMDTLATTPVPAAPTDTFAGPLPPALYRPNNLVFLIDVSSSMRKKMPQLKAALTALVKALRPHDYISVITYSTVAAVKARGLSGARKDTLQRLIAGLDAEGMTYGIRGLRKAYEIARENYIDGGNNQVILITDGEFNSPDYSRLDLFRLVKDHALVPIKLSVVSLAEKQGVGRTLQMAAMFGRGNYIRAKAMKRSATVLLEEVRKQSRKSGQ